MGAFILMWVTLASPSSAARRRDCSGIRNSFTRRPSQLAGSRTVTHTAQVEALFFFRPSAFSSRLLHADPAIGRTHDSHNGLCHCFPRADFSESHRANGLLTRRTARTRIRRNCLIIRRLPSNRHWQRGVTVFPVDTIGVKGIVPHPVVRNRYRSGSKWFAETFRKTRGQSG